MIVDVNRDEAGQQNEARKNLYLCVTREQLKDIKANGVQAGTAFKSHSLAQKSYFEHEGANEESFILMVDAMHISDGAISLDMNAVTDPDVDHIGETKFEIWSRWEASDQTWQDSLDIVHSVVCEQSVPASLLNYCDDYFAEPEHMPLMR